MEVHLTADQKAFIRQAIERGQYDHEEDAVKDALALWEERERIRTEILLAIDLADGSIATGKGVPIGNESMRELADRVKQRSRSRLAADPRSR